MTASGRACPGRRSRVAAERASACSGGGAAPTRRAVLRPPRAPPAEDPRSSREAPRPSHRRRREYGLRRRRGDRLLREQQPQLVRRRHGVAFGVPHAAGGGEGRTPHGHHQAGVAGQGPRQRQEPHPLLLRERQVLEVDLHRRLRRRLAAAGHEEQADRRRRRPEQAAVHQRALPGRQPGDIQRPPALPLRRRPEPRRHQRAGPEQLRRQVVRGRHRRQDDHHDVLDEPGRRVLIRPAGRGRTAAPQPGVGCGAARGTQTRSKRSSSMTLTHAATKSPTNLSFASSLA
ncbi:hypothetical protein SCOCK_30195 [Actinacidiphila cocklensis]|uniref:Uncharacterized protein n=1 Tax=Actinacidiphila cocklensis TaxID=887465 RepID=A0A9W4DWT6_9ACTN|nr:hypothetical protein SCOCK_30195 [Actinacidiphila cocklensis]